MLIYCHLIVKKAKLQRNQCLCSPTFSSFVLKWPPPPIRTNSTTDRFFMFKCLWLLWSWLDICERDWIPAGSDGCLTSEPVVQCRVHRVLHDGQELSGEQRVPLPPVAVQHPAVPQLHHQTQLPQGEGVRQVAAPQGSHRLPHGEGGTTEHDWMLPTKTTNCDSFVVEFPIFLFLNGILYYL